MGCPQCPARPLKNIHLSQAWKENWRAPHVYHVLVFTKANYEDCSPTLKTYTENLTPELLNSGTSLVVQWLRLYTSNVEPVGLIPGQGTRIPHALQAERKIARFSLTFGNHSVSWAVRKELWNLMFFPYFKNLMRFSLSWCLNLLEWHEFLPDPSAGKHSSSLPSRRSLHCHSILPVLLPEQCNFHPFVPTAAAPPQPLWPGSQAAATVSYTHLCLWYSQALNLSFL